MFMHVLAVRLKPDVSDAQKDRTAEALQQLQGQIPGLLKVSVGTNQSARSQGYNFVAGMQFADHESLQAYDNHPAHQEVVPMLLPLVADIVEVDYEV